MPPPPKLIQAVRDATRDVPVTRGAHAGLILDSYLSHQGDPEIRRGLFAAARDAVKNTKDLYAKAYARYRDSLDASTGTIARAQVKTAGRFVTGLGIESVLETGLRLHHTYGTPIIPGSSLKGLCAHYAAEVWATGDPSFAEGGASYRTIFGDQDDKGFIAFHDAWILPGTLQSSLVEDVMTPHYMSYYGGSAPPTDEGDPNPVQFLSVRGTFLLTIVCEDKSDAGKSWANLTLELCKAALADWGAGGKTAAGYGRFLPG